MLLLRDLRPGGDSADVGVADRLTLHPCLLPPHRDGLLHLLGGDVLARPHPPPLRWAVPTRSSSSEHVMASSAVGPEVSRPTASRPVARLLVKTSPGPPGASGLHRGGRPDGPAKG